MANTQLTIYDNALGFANAYRLLYGKTSISNIEKEPTYSNGSMIMPTLVNGAFACELFFKALLKSDAHGHSLVELYEKIEEEDLKEACIIKKTCIAIMQEKFHYNDYNESQFILDLGIYDEAFKELRYWHEPDVNHKRIGKAYSLAFLEVLVAVLQTQCQMRYGERPLKTS